MGVKPDCIPSQRCVWVGGDAWQPVRDRRHCLALGRQRHSPCRCCPCHEKRGVLIAGVCVCTCASLNAPLWLRGATRKRNANTCSQSCHLVATLSKYGAPQRSFRLAPCLQQWLRHLPVSRAEYAAGAGHGLVLRGPGGVATHSVPRARQPTRLCVPACTSPSPIRMRLRCDLGTPSPSRTRTT